MATGFRNRRGRAGAPPQRRFLEQPQALSPGQRPRNGRERARRRHRFGDDFRARGVFRIGGQIVGAQENGPHAGEAVLQLIPKREAVHRLQENLGDQQIDSAPLLAGLEGRSAGCRGADIVAGGLLQEIDVRGANRPA